MPVHLKVETEVDGTSAQAAANKLQAHFQNAGRDSGVVFGKELSATMSTHLASASVQRDLQNTLNTISKYGDATGKEFATNMASRMHIELTNAGQTHGTAYANAFSHALEGVASRVASQFGFTGKATDQVIQKITSGAGVAALAVGGIGIAAAGVVTELYNLGSEWDTITDGITGKTGIVGAQLDGITESIKNVGVNSSASLSEIGDVAGSLVQSLHLTGQPLEDVTTRIADLNELTGDKLNVRDLGKVFHGFGIEASDMAPTLDRLYDVFTNTGIPVSQLIETLKTVGPTAREISPDIGVAAGDIVTLEDAGINAEDAFKGLKIAMGNLSKEKAPGSLGDFLKDEQGKDLNTKIGDLIVKIRETGDIDLAKSAFGKSWQPIFEAIRNGKVDVDTLNTSVANTGHTIEGSKGATDDWAEEFKKLKNTLTVELEPAAKVVFGGISAMIKEWLIKPFQELNDLVRGAAHLFDDYRPPSSPPGAPGVPGVPPGPGGGPALGPPSGGGSPGQNPLDIFAPTSGGHPGPPQTGGAGNSFGAGGVEQSVHQAMLGAGWSESEWPALRTLIQHESGFSPTAHNASGAHGIFQFMPYTWSTVGGSFTNDPGLQTQYGLQYIKQRYGSPSAAWAQYYNHAGGEGSYNRGGGVDTVPAMLTPGEHVLTTDDVNAMGGQSGVYAFRNMLHGYDIGGDIPLAELIPDEPYRGKYKSPGSSGEGQPHPEPSNPEFGSIPRQGIRTDLGWWGTRGPSGNVVTSIPWWGEGGSGRAPGANRRNRRGIQGFQAGGTVGDAYFSDPHQHGDKEPGSDQDRAGQGGGHAYFPPWWPWSKPGRQVDLPWGFDVGGGVPPVDPNMQMAQSFAGGLQQGGGWGGLIGGFVNMALNASQAAGGPNSVQPGAEPTGKGGGSSQGGAGGALGMAAGMLPGGQVAAALAMRAAKFGAQLLSIGIMGGLETFLPGGTPLSDPSKSLVGRVASGVAGGQPASQNMAGAAKPPAPAPPLGSPASGTGLGPLPGPTNNGVHIDTMIVQNGDGEAAARDINRAYHSQSAGDNSR